MGNVIIRRVDDTSHVQAAHINVEHSQFVLATAEREEKGMIELQNKYKEVVEAYNKEVKRRIELEGKLKEKLTRARIAYPPRPPVEPFKSTPIIEILDTLERPQSYIATKFEEKLNKLYEMQRELDNWYEEKVTRTIMYLIDRIEGPTFYDQLARIVALRDETKRDEGKLKSITQKWNDRNDDIINMYVSVIQLSCHQMDKIFDLLDKLKDFDEKQGAFLRRPTFCFSKYKAEKKNLFHSALESIDRIKEKEKCKNELDEIMCERMSDVVNVKWNILWALTTEELVRVQFFYKAINKDLNDIELLGNFVIEVQREVPRFDWPDDSIYNTWKEEFMSP